MGWIDWAVFFAFLAYVVWDGIRHRSKSGDLEGYYAGGRKIPWWAAGLSIMATQASAITVIGTTGQGHDGGMEFVQSYFGLPFAMVLLCIFLVPYFRSRNVLTPYQLLEERFGPASRTLASECSCRRRSARSCCSRVCASTSSSRERTRSLRTPTSVLPSTRACARGERHPFCGPRAVLAGWDSGDCVMGGEGSPCRHG